jgi:hypothetical protein
LSAGSALRVYAQCIVPGRGNGTDEPIGALDSLNSEQVMQLLTGARGRTQEPDPERRAGVDALKQVGCKCSAWSLPQLDRNLVDPSRLPLDAINAQPGRLKAAVQIGSSMAVTLGWLWSVVLP